MLAYPVAGNPPSCNQGDIRNLLQILDMPSYAALGIGVPTLSPQQAYPSLACDVSLIPGSRGTDM
jgi:hypothetical protein